MQTLFDTLSLYLAIVNKDELAVRQLLAAYYEQYELETKYPKNKQNKQQPIHKPSHPVTNCRVMIERLMQVSNYQYVDYLRQLY